MDLLGFFSSLVTDVLGTVPPLLGEAFGCIMDGMSMSIDANKVAKVVRINR